MRRLLFLFGSQSAGDEGINHGLSVTPVVTRHWLHDWRDKWCVCVTVSRCAIRDYDRLSQDFFIHSLFAGHIDLPLVFQRWEYSRAVITSKRILGLRYAASSQSRTHWVGWTELCHRTAKRCSLICLWNLRRCLTYTFTSGLLDFGPRRRNSVTLSRPLTRGTRAPAPRSFSVSRFEVWVNSQLACAMHTGRLNGAN